MKATIEIDEKKLSRIMKLNGIKTKRQAIDFALTEAERISRLRNVFSNPFFSDSAKKKSKTADFDPNYDVVALRKKS